MSVESWDNPFDTLEGDPAGWLAAYVSDRTCARAAADAIARAVSAHPAEAVRAALANVRAAGPKWDGNPADPVLRDVMRAWSGAFARTDVVNAAVLRDPHLVAPPAGVGPTVLVSNHLSYIDTTVTDLALVRAGAATFADAMFVVAGPKVWGTPLHALATSALNIVPTQQSTRIDPGAASESRKLLRGLRLAQDKLVARVPLLVYPEGTRARSRRLGPFLKGVRHYLSQPGTRIVPIALSGSDQVYPIDASLVGPAEVRLEVGPVIEVDDPDAALLLTREVIADLLPVSYRPDRTTPSVV